MLPPAMWKAWVEVTRSGFWRSWRERANQLVAQEALLAFFVSWTFLGDIESLLEQLPNHEEVVFVTLE